MSCTQWSGQWGEALTNGAFLDAILCPYQTQVGGVVFGLFVYGVVMTALYIRTDSVIAPLVGTIVVGVLLIPQLPAGGFQIIAAVLILALAVGGYFVATQVQNAT